MALTVVIMTVIGYAALYFTGSSNLMILIIVITAIFGFGTGGVYYIPWTVYTFLADVDELVTGRRREGIYAGTMTFAGKLVRAVIVFLLGWILEQFGFVSGKAVQPESAVNAIVWVLAVGVIGLALIAIFVTYKMKLDSKTHAMIIKEIERINNGGSKLEVDKETKEMVEYLTGFKYEECFGNNTLGYQARKTV
ncbi:MFS transporter [Niallia taxi]